MNSNKEELDSLTGKWHESMSLDSAEALLDACTLAGVNAAVYYVQWKASRMHRLVEGDESVCNDCGTVYKVWSIYHSRCKPCYGADKLG